MKIVTPRLVLDELEAQDVESLFLLESDPEVVRYQDYPPRTREECVDYIRQAIESRARQLRNHTELAVRCNDAFIGRVGASVMDRQAMLWYAFLPTAQGQGFATEAARAFVASLFESGLHRITIECDPRNTPSWRLAERLGFRREAHHIEGYWSKGEWTDSYIYAKLRQEQFP